MRRGWIVTVVAVVAAVAAWFLYHEPLTPVGAYFGWWLFTRPMVAGAAGLVGAVIALLLTRSAEPHAGERDALR